MVSDSESSLFWSYMLLLLFTGMEWVYLGIPDSYILPSTFVSSRANPQELLILVFVSHNVHAMAQRSIFQIYDALRE